MTLTSKTDRREGGREGKGEGKKSESKWNGLGGGRGWQGGK